MMPDFNGWADEPEEEREALAQFEMTGSRPAPRRRGLMHDHQNGKGNGAGSPIVYARSPMRRTSRRETWAVYDTSLTPLDAVRGEATSWPATRTPGSPSSDRIP